MIDRIYFVNGNPFHLPSIFTIVKTNRKGHFDDGKQEQTLLPTMYVLYRCEECSFTSAANDSEAYS